MTDYLYPHFLDKRLTCEHSLQMTRPRRIENHHLLGYRFSLGYQYVESWRGFNSVYVQKDKEDGHWSYYDSVWYCFKNQEIADKFFDDLLTNSDDYDTVLELRKVVSEYEKYWVERNKT